MINMTDRFFKDAPHTHPQPHHPPHPHHPHHNAVDHRHRLVSVQHNSEKMQEVYGETWPYHLERIASEPPEMKMIFALTMGFSLTVNQQIAEIMIRNYKEEPECDFPSPAFNDTTLSALSQRLNISEDIAAVILRTTVPGVTSVIVSMLRM